MELDERKAAILQAVVEEHIHTAQPVGSQTIARSRGMKVSSATVRNDMTILEREGYLVQPHTSAGRIPTDLGYRYFVDHLTESSLAPVQRRAVANFFELFASAHQVLEDLLHETSQLLARVSTHTAVVVGPHADVATVRHVQLVTLQPSVVLVLVVLSNGSVERLTLHLVRELDDTVVAAAGTVLDTELANARWGHLPQLRGTGRADVDALVRIAREALVQHHDHDPGEPLYVGGASRLAAEHDAFATATGAAQLLELLEHQVEVVSLVRDLLDQGTSVSIGSENPIEELRDCSIVVAPYRVEGQVVGTVGVLGPTRMDYRQALAAVEAISRQLGDALS
jgi:heat-inducible transcriptional repressor